MAARKLYRIFAGLNGGFGGATQVDIEEHSNESDAQFSAYDHAIRLYESQSGTGGLISWEEAREEAENQYGDIDEYNQPKIDDMTEQIFIEAAESWIDYYVIETTSEDVKLIPILDPDL